jgi:site-specific DNA recombinase
MKAAIYARYSSDNQREESITAQVRAIEEYAQRNGYTLVKTYVDEARSATTDNRPQFLKMIKDSYSGNFEFVIVHKLDRFSRDRYDSAFYKKQLKKNGVKIVSVLENLDDSPESIILESVLTGMAEYYSKNLAREVKKGMKETALQCKHTGGIPPLGYDVDPVTKKYIENREESKIVKFIFDKYSNGAGYDIITNECIERGYMTKLGRNFGRSSMHDLLKNEKYTGMYIFNRATCKIDDKRNNRKENADMIKIPGGMPRIVSDEVFEKVKLRMNDNKRKAVNTAKEVYLLSGLIFCGKCNGAMIGHTSYSGRSKSKHSTYLCGTRKNQKTCDMKAINKDLVENFVVDNVEQEILNPKSIKILRLKLIEKLKDSRKEYKQDMASAKNKVTLIEKEIENIVNAIAGGMFHPSMKDKMTNLENDKSIAQSIIYDIEQKQALKLDEKLIDAYLKRDMEDFKNKEDLKRIIQGYVSKVIVYPESVEVQLKVVFTDGGGEELHAINTTIHESYYKGKAI